jgi:hypothetical protein
VKITLVIFKSEMPIDHDYGPFMNGSKPGENAGYRVELQDKFVICKNSKPTEWYGVAFSKATIGGRLQYAGRTQSPQKKIFNCGT